MLVIQIKDFYKIFPLSFILLPNDGKLLTTGKYHSVLDFHQGSSYKGSVWEFVRVAGIKEYFSGTAAFGASISLGVPHCVTDSRVTSFHFQFCRHDSPTVREKLTYREPCI